MWGVYAKPDFKTCDSLQSQKTHLQFCKRFLEVNNKVSNVACGAEDLVAYLKYHHKSKHPQLHFVY